MSMTAILPISWYWSIVKDQVANGYFQAVCRAPHLGEVFPPQVDRLEVFPPQPFPPQVVRLPVFRRA